MENVNPYPSFTAIFQSRPRRNGDAPTSPTTDEESAKIADMVERRKLQNRNAQRKYRKNLKRREAALGQQDVGAASRTTTPESRSIGPTPQRRICHLPAELGITQDAHDTARNPRPLKSPTHTAAPMDVAVKCPHCLPHLCNASPPPITPTYSISKWPSTDDLLDRWSLNGKPDGQDSAFALEQPPVMPMTRLTEPMGFPDPFEIPSVCASLSPSSDGMQRPDFESRSNSTSYSPGIKPGITPGHHLGYTMLHIAAVKGDHAMTRLLLEKGSDPNGQDNHGWTPLHLAVGQGHQDIANLLLENGANLHAITQK